MDEVVDVETGELLPERRSVAALGPKDFTDALVRPAASVDEIVDAFRAYVELGTKLLTADDIQRIGPGEFRKRSGWRKLGTAFGVSYEVRGETTDRDEAGDILRTRYTVRAIAPNGRYADGVGVCDVHERCCERGCARNHQHCARAKGNECSGRAHFTHAEHDIPATAETRSKNRAASDLFGMGEVSAEEVADVRLCDGEQLDVIRGLIDQMSENQQRLFAAEWTERKRHWGSLKRRQVPVEAFDAICDLAEDILAGELEAEAQDEVEGGEPFTEEAENDG